jgi:renalase
LTQRIAVIGAGVAGLSCARVLRQAGCYVEVFEQDRIIGGRMATLRLGATTFDHGAQYLTGRSQRFQNYIKELEGTGYLAKWSPKVLTKNGQEGQMLQDWYVGVPGMSSIVRPLAESVRIHTSRKVHTIARDTKGWHIWFDNQESLGPFSAVAVAVPAPEARLLLGRIDGVPEQLARVRMTPCWSLMVKLDEQVLPDQDVFSDMSEVVRWIGRNSSKPGRKAPGETIVVHASPSWSRELEEVEPDEVAEELWSEVCRGIGLPPTRPTMMSAHLWRHGLVDTSVGETYLFSSEHRVGAAGDWCLGRLAEHAFESGHGLGKAIINSIM